MLSWCLDLFSRYMEIRNKSVTVSIRLQKKKKITTTQVHSSDAPSPINNSVCCNNNHLTRKFVDLVHSLAT